MAPKPPPPKNFALMDAESRQNAKRIAAEIRDDVEGRVCRTCIHAVMSTSGMGECMALYNIHGKAVTIKRTDATACRDAYIPSCS